MGLRGSHPTFRHLSPNFHIFCDTVATGKIDGSQTAFLAASSMLAFSQGGAGGTFDVTIIHSEKEKPADGPVEALANCLLTDSCSPSMAWTHDKEKCRIRLQSNLLSGDVSY